MSPIGDQSSTGDWKLALSADAKRVAFYRLAINRAAAFTRLDTHHDDSLPLAEYLTGMNGTPNLEQRFKDSDKNGDGKLSRAEFATPSVKSPYLRLQFRSQRSATTVRMKPSPRPSRPAPTRGR